LLRYFTLNQREKAISPTATSPNNLAGVTFWTAPPARFMEIVGAAPTSMSPRANTLAREIRGASADRLVTWDDRGVDRNFKLRFPYRP